MRTRPPVARYTVRRQPPSGVARLPGSSRSEVSTSEVGRRVGSSGGVAAARAASASASAGARSDGGAASVSPAASWSAAARTSDHGTEGPRSGGASSGMRGAAYGSGDQTCLGASLSAAAALAGRAGG